MADRQWFMPGIDAIFRGGMIDEEGTEEYFVPAVGMINEDQAAAAVSGRVMSSLVGSGGLAGHGGIAGVGGTDGLGAIKAETALIVDDTGTTGVVIAAAQTVATVTTLTGHTAQTGDSFARIGVAGAGLTNINLPNQTMDITGNLSGSVGSLTGHTPQTGDTFALADGASGFVAIDTKTTNLPVDPASESTIIAATDANLAAIAALNNFDPTAQLTEDYAANGVAPDSVQLWFAIHQMLMEFGITGTSWTVRKLDGVATAFVVTLDDDTNPTDAKRV